MTDYTRLHQLAEQATPGPWRTWRDDTGNRGGSVETEWAHDEDGADTEPITDWCKPADAEFIAAANPDTILRLLDELHLYKTTMREARAIAWDAGLQAGLDWDKSYPDNPRRHNPYRENR